MGKMPIQKSPLTAACVEKPLNYNLIFTARKAFSRSDRIKPVTQGSKKAARKSDRLSFFLEPGLSFVFYTPSPLQRPSES